MRPPKGWRVTEQLIKTRKDDRMRTAMQFVFWHSVLALANFAVIASGCGAGYAIYYALWIEGIL